MLINIPDGYPLGAGSFGQAQPVTDPAVVAMAKSILKEAKAERKRKKAEEEKKKDKSKPKTFTLLETWGILLLASIPCTLAQIQLLSYAKTVMSTAFNAPH